MTDITTLHSYRCDLDIGPCEVRLPHPLMHQDALADVFRVAVHRDHVPVDLSGMTVCGYLLLHATRQTILLEGEINSHCASVTLTDDCYAQPGHCSLVIQLQDGEIRHTVLKADALIQRTGTEEMFIPNEYASLAQLLERIEALEQGGAAAAYADLNALAASPLLKPGMVCMVAGASVTGDGGAGLYRIREADALETASDGDAIILLKNGLVAEKVDRWLRAGRHSFPFSVDEGIQNELLECALSYYRSNSKLIYGNSYTANNMAPDRAPQYSDSYDAAGNQLMQLDCSSFIELVYSGVPYGASRYIPGNEENSRCYGWGFSWDGKERYYHTANGSQQRMLANDMALYCRDRGWLIEPNEDFSNCQTGDLLFFANTDYQDENYFGQIHHVAMFLWNNGYGNTVAMHCQTSDKEHPVTVNCMATSYRGTVCAVARLPLTRSRASVPENLFTDAEAVRGTHYAGEKKFFLCTGNTAEAFQPSTFYTVAARITQAENQQEQNITFRPLDVTTAIDRIRKPSVVSPDGYYEAHFFVNDKMEIVNSPSGRIPLGDTPCTGITLAAYVYDEDGNYVEGGCVQTDTTIEWIELFKGVYHPDHQSYLPSAQRADKLASTTAYVDLTDSIAPLNALHEGAKTREVYFATVRTQDAQEPLCGLAIDRNYLLMGWRQSDAFGKQIVFNYATNEVLTRNLYNGVWTDFSDTRDSAYPYPMPMANLGDSDLEDVSTLLAPVDAFHHEAANGSTYWATVRTMNVKTEAGIAALNGLPASRVYQLTGWRYHDEYGRQVLVSYMNDLSYVRTMVGGVWSEFHAEGAAADAPITEADRAAGAATAAATAANTAAGAANAAKDEALSAATAARQTALEISGTAAPAIIPTSTGSIVTVTDAADRPAVEVISHITPKQEGSGDPSPDNVRPISGWDAVTANVTGANLFGGVALADKLVSVAGATMNASAGTVTYYASSMANSPALLKGVFKPNTQYTIILYGRGSSNFTNIAVYYSDDTSYVAKFSASTDGYVVYTTTAGKTVASISGIYYDGSTTLYYDKCGVFEGVYTTAAFVPYQGQTTSASLPETVYGGTLDWVTGVLAVTHRKITFDGVTAGAKMDGTDFVGASYAYMNREALTRPLKDKGKAFANKINGVGTNSVLSISLPDDLTGVTSTDAKDVVVSKYNAVLKQWYDAGSPLEIVYEVDAPEEIQLTPQQISTTKGTCNAWSDTGDTTLTYIADTKMYIDQRITALLNL